MKPSHPILREIFTRREQVQETLLAGTPTGIPADQVGIAYASLIGRYRELVELEEFVTTLLASGESIEQDDSSGGKSG